MVWGNRPRYGAHIVHLSIAVMTIGVVGSTFFVTTTEGNLKVGETITGGRLHAALRGHGPGRHAQPRDRLGDADRAAERQPLGQLRPEMIFHKSLEQPVSEVAIRTTLLEDLYVILAGWTQDGTATFKVLVNPLVVWIWIGGVLCWWAGWSPCGRRRARGSAVRDEALEPAPSAV